MYEPNTESTFDGIAARAQTKYFGIVVVVAQSHTVK